MKDNIESKRFWEERYDREQYIWGKEPGDSAYHAFKLFESRDIQTVLIPGAGYGRNAKLFADEFQVTGVEISGRALTLAEDFSPRVEFIKGNVRNLADRLETDRKFDAIYCFNVLHLFKKKGREKFLTDCADVLREGGYAYFVVFSEKEASYGQGERLEENTFLFEPGKPVHYFTRDDLRKHFAEFEILAEGMVEDRENHGSGPHVHKLRYVFGRL